MSGEADVLFEEIGLAGVITLNRPKALNALTLDMVREIRPKLKAWAGDPRIARVIIRAAGDRAFCAGGDIRALHDWGRARAPEFLDFYREEYQLNAFIKHFPKPYIALLDGITMGGGVGLSVHGSHRVATERLTFAMPETGIGLFPDVGGTYFLPRCPGAVGMYLGLTGARIKAADALNAGIATHAAASADLPALLERLTEATDVEDALAAYARPPAEAPLAAMRDSIDRHFRGDSVEAILASLESDPGEWAQQNARALRGKSPTSLKIAHRQLKEGAKLGFDDCMRLEYRLVNRVFEGHDFYEGVRAVIIDKDQEPKWQPASLAEVSPAMVDAYFAPLPAELPL
ncbi:enoyl-CoA hydratase/isomerase family protein [Rhodoligotrophos defluvii]|uniref:enoyl-CoA hydratase/isomerase family protein n=1 Tax=Rhodoligotrophos defluvii TaxID=2561934 RepID=UPI0010C96E36|nr:enoyl-CoA hydratase/isomerase family protein [Rhodoligotrophos defluvii]